MPANNLGQFTASLDASKTYTKQQLSYIVQGVTLEVGKNVSVGGDFSPGTPVDTGYARASWFLSVGSPSEERLEKVEAPANRKGSAFYRRNPAGDLVRVAMVQPGEQIAWWTNNADYIEALEGGHSQQAPEGFVALTLASGQRILDLVVLKLQQRNRL